MTTHVNPGMNSEMPLGSVIQGSLSQGLEVRLHADVSVEDMRVGKFLVVQGVRSGSWPIPPIPPSCFYKRSWQAAAPTAPLIWSRC